jgi:hypothetical protein
LLRPKLPLTPVERPRRNTRRGVRGQSLAIFAICAIVLFGICGLAIDTGVSYLNANKVERAAAAGALAGVTYMPNQYATALTAAAAAVQRNGGYVDSGPNNTKVYVYRVPIGCGTTTPCLPNRLGVGVQTDVSNTFTKLLGFGPSHSVRQDAVAEYLSTLTLGQPGAQLGSTQSEISASPQQGFYFLRTEGWGAPRSEGDAYTPNPNIVGSTDVHTISGELGTEVTSLPAGFTQFPPAAKDCGGYDFQIQVPSSGVTGPVHVDVYNPAHMPDSTNSYHENDSTFSSGTAAQYDQMVYTLFQEQDPFNRQSDIPMTQLVVNPVNATTAPSTTWVDQKTGQTLLGPTAAAFYQKWIDVASGTYINGESGGAHLTSFATNVAGGVTAPFALATGQTYRLRVDTYDGTGKGCSLSSVGQGPPASSPGGGHKGYSLRVTDNGALCSGCTLGGLNELAFYTPLVASGATTTFDIPMVNVPAVYAGQTIDIYAFDPGDVGNATNYIDIINPCIIVSGSCTSGIVSENSPSNIKLYDLGINKATDPKTCSCLVDTTHWPSQSGSPVQARVLTSTGGAHPYDHHWLLFKIPVPNNYAPATPAGQYWSLRYELSGGTASDTLTLSVGFDGPPVHLVPNP